MAELGKFTVSLGIYGEKLNIAEITKMLQVAPTCAYQKGQQHKNQTVAKRGAWLLELSVAAGETDPEQKVNELLDKVTADNQVWETLQQHYYIRLFCGIFLAQSNEGFSFSPPLLKRIAEKGLNLEFDIYSA